MTTAILADATITDAAIKFVAAVFAVMIIWMSHPIVTGLIAVVWPQPHLTILYKDGRPAAGLRVSNHRGSTRTTDRDGQIKHPKRAWVKQGTTLNINCSGRVYQVRVRLDKDGNPKPTILDE